MKKMILPFTIFGIMLIGIFFATNYTVKTCDYLLNLTTETEETIAFEKWDDAYVNSLKLLTDYEDSIKLISLFSEHQHLDNVYVEILKLTQYVNEKDKTHSLSSVHSIKGLIKSMKDEESITLRNIF